jgi:ADP-heptose:LPS heptosyltransferase
MDSEDEFRKRLFALDDEDFVSAAYEIFLDRDPDPSGMRNYTAKLRRGDGRINVLSEMAASREARDKNLPVPQVIYDIISSETHPEILEEALSLHDKAFIRFAYRIILGRDADQDGLAENLSQVRKGTSRYAILARLRLSPEGKARDTNIPGLNATIRKYKWRTLPVVGKLVRLLGIPKDPINVTTTLQRIESNLVRFKNSALGEGLSSSPTSRMAGFGFGQVAPEWATVAKMAADSKRITGNPSLPGRILTEGVEIRKILIFKLDHMGDFFISIRPIAMLRKAWPDAEITLVCGPWNVALAEKLGLLDRIVPYRFFTAKTGEEEFSWDTDDWLARCDGVRDLDLGQFDLAIDLRHDSDTRPCLTRIESSYRVGFASPGGALPPTPPLDLSLLEIPPEHREQLHAESRIVALVSLTIETFLPPAIHPIRLLIDKNEAFHPFDNSKPYVVVAPGAGSPNRTWEPQRFVELMQRVASKLKLGIVIIGGPSEASANAQIASHFLRKECVDLTGCDLTTLPQLIDGAAVYVGNDTGGGHLAAMLGTPTLSVYGGVSDPRVWQPIGPKVAIVHSQTPCSYCHLNLRKDCKHALRCMTEIEVDDVYDQFLALYNRFVRGRLEPSQEMEGSMS